MRFSNKIRKAFEVFWVHFILISISVGAEPVKGPRVLPLLLQVMGAMCVFCFAIGNSEDGLLVFVILRIQMSILLCYNKFWADLTRDT